jgi:Cu(I)/Ag(I) efflux system membrane fusion protein
MKRVLLLALVAGFALGAGATYWLLDRAPALDAADAEPQPIYWVAPMDPNYRRDKPGKSPMGMDLVPVYAEPASAQQDSKGTVRISPEVINNLGVRTARAERRQLENSVRTVGYVQYDEDRLIHIHPRVEGWIEKLQVKAAGDPVSRGQALYALYSPELVNAQEELLLAMNRDNRRLIEAAEDRLLALQLSDDFVAELKRERKVRQTVTFYSPQQGVVDNLNIREGFYVKPDNTLMSIGSLESVWVEAEVFERQADRVSAGMAATMTLEYLPGKTWRGRVDYIYPTLAETTRTLRLRLRFDNPDGALKPNMFAQVTLHSDDDQPRLAIPAEALIRTGLQDRVVLALGNGRFKSVQVRVGRMDDSHVEVLEGLEAGDGVVTSAQFLLDSESSTSSDFRRMHREHGAMNEAETRAPGVHQHD